MYMRINKFLVFNRNMFKYKNIVVQNDLIEIRETPISWNQLEGKSCLVTGANGMIATYMVYLLMSLVQEKGMNIHIIALSRNRKKSEELFSDFLKDPHFELLIQDVCDPIHIEGQLDFLFHFAGNASPYYIKNDPVGIMKSNLLGTINVLELARKKGVEKVMFTSTREVYGENKNMTSLTETSFGIIDCMDGRSCYPESKRAAESLCKSYYLQYGVNFNSVRIAHTYGPNMKLDNDGRVMADLIGFVTKGKNIVLKSQGNALRAFCYITDTLLGLMYILFYGEKADAYNLANEKEEISIYSLAEILIEISQNKDLKIDYEILNNQSNIYCNYIRIGLNTSKLESLGWQPTIGLKDGLTRIFRAFQSCK